MMMIIMVGVILRKDTYTLSENEVNSFFEDDIGGMDIAFSGILGKILCV